MMLAHPQMETVFDFDEHCVQTLIIEEPMFFRCFLKDIAGQIEGLSGKLALSSDFSPIPFSQNAELIDSILSFQMGRKTLLNKVISRMESTALSEAYYVRTAELMGSLECLFADIAFDLPCDVVCAKMNIGSILKAAGVEFCDDYDNDLERLLDYMEIVRELDREKLFVFVNLRSYYPDEEIRAFISTALSHEYRVLMVESSAHSLLSNENRTTVDADLCEF